MGRIFSLFVVFFLLFTFDESKSKGSFGKTGSFKSYKSFKYQAPVVKKEKSNYYKKHYLTKKIKEKNKPFFMSPIFRWLVGGMIFGALLSLLFGYGFHIGTPGLLEIILILGVAYLFFKKSQKKQILKQQTGKEIQTEESVKTQENDDVDEEYLKNFVKNLFIKLQKEWTNGELLPLKSFLTDKMYNHLDMQLIDLTERKLKNVIDDVKVKNVDIIHVEDLGDKKVVIAEIEAQMIDYIEDDLGKVIKGNKEKPISRKEYWTLVGKGFNWKLSNIKRVEG